MVIILFSQDDSGLTFCRVLSLVILLLTNFHGVESGPLEFFLNVFTEFSKFSEKNICHYSKRAQICDPVTSCVRDQDATTAPARHMWHTGSLNWAQFMFQWFISFPEFAEFSEFLFYPGKTPLNLSHRFGPTLFFLRMNVSASKCANNFNKWKIVSSIFTSA